MGHLGGAGAEVTALERGDVEPEQLGMEAVGGGLGELGEGADAGVKQEAVIVAADFGDAGKVGEGEPFVEVARVNLKIGEELLVALGRSRSL